MNITATTTPRSASRSRKKVVRGHRSFNDLLKLFPRVLGCEQRIRYFVSLCRQYCSEVKKDEALDALYRSEKRRSRQPNAKRRKLHDEIMTIVGKLFLQLTAERIFGGPQPNRDQVREKIVKQFTSPSVRKPRRLRKRRRLH